MTAATVSLAQAALTLGSTLFVRDHFMSITTERGRIHAVAKKDRKVTSCFGVMTLSWFVLSLYMSAYVAMRGCEPVTKCHPRFLLAMCQRNPSRRSHVRFT